MGYRAQVIKQHREYGSSIFSDYTQFEEYLSRMRDLYPDEEIYESESQDFFEISKDAVEKEIKRLTEIGLEKDFEFQSYWSGDHKENNGSIAELWKEALEQSPEDCYYVALEWY